MATATLELVKPSKTKVEKAVPLLRPPKPEIRFHLRQVANLAIQDGLTYREAQNLLRAFLIDSALRSKGGVKTDAAALLGITRDHVREFSKRGKDLF